MDKTDNSRTVTLCHAKNPRIVICFWFVRNGPYATWLFSTKSTRIPNFLTPANALLVQTQADSYGSRNRKTKQGLWRDPGRISCQSDLSNLIEGKKTEISTIFSVFLSEMAWPGDTRHQFCTVPELAKTGFEPHTGGITWRA